MNSSDADARIAERAWRFIEDEARPYVRRGGRLWTKTRGFHGVNPATTLRDILKPLDNRIPATFTTLAAAKPGALVDREHAMPVKRIAIEMIDPMQGDPRCHSDRILVGAAEGPEDILRVYHALAVVVMVSRAEHARLAKAHASSRWDAWEGDWRKRYEMAGLEVLPINHAGDNDLQRP
jgi:hypothetical protein